MDILAWLTGLVAVGRFDDGKVVGVVGDPSLSRAWPAAANDNRVVILVC